MEEKLNELKGLVAEIEKDQDKFVRTGSKAAIVRIRKSLQSIKVLTKDYRATAIEARDNVSKA